MNEWDRAELKRMRELKRDAKKLERALTKVRAKYDARGIPLKVIVDNDSWHLTTTRDEDWTEEIGEDLHKVRTRDLDVGPEYLACMFACMVGFDAGRP